MTATPTRSTGGRAASCAGACVAGLIGRGTGRLADLALNARQRALGVGRELDALAAEGPRRDVLVLGIYGGDGAELEAALRRVRESVHNVRVALGSMGPAAPGLADDTALLILRPV